MKGDTKLSLLYKSLTIGEIKLTNYDQHITTMFVQNQLIGTYYGYAANYKKTELMLPCVIAITDTITITVKAI